MMPHIAMLVGAVGHVVRRQVRDCGERLWPVLRLPPSPPLHLGHGGLELGDLRHQLAARASSLAFLASPNSFEAELRRACACSDSKIAARRFSSIASSDGRQRFKPPPFQRGVEVCGLSRIDLMSCMAGIIAGRERAV